MLDDAHIDRTRKQLKNRLLFRFYALRKLPMVFLAGIRISAIDDALCEVRLKHSWLVRNPFRSTFWAVLGMAAELATGALLVAYTRNQKPRISFILIRQEATFHKKGRGHLRFICNHARRVREAVLLAMENTDRHELVLPARAVNEEGALVADMQFTWILQQRD